MNNEKTVTNIHIYPSYFTNESRILREATALIESKLVHQIYLVGFWKSGIAKREFLNPAIEIIRIESGFGKSRYWKWLNVFGFIIFYIKAFRFSIAQKPTVINAHALTVLPLCVWVKFFTKAKLIYDAHELETETNDSRGLRKVIAKVMERSLIGFVDFTIVVSPSIKTWYEKTYKLVRIEVVRSIPDSTPSKEKSNSIRSLSNIPKDHLVFLYVGTFVKGRGVEMMLSAFKKTSPNKHLVFMGYGPLEEEIKKAVAKQENIHFLPAVASNQVVGITATADVGMSFIENTCLSYYYCLPNKVFEYISAGIPFISSDFPDLKNEFSPYDISWFVNSEEKLVDVINAVTPEMLDTKKKNILTNEVLWKWDNEKKIVLSIYSKLLT